MSTALAPRPALTYNLTPVQTVLDHALYRAKHRTTLNVPKIADLNLHWEDQGPKHTQSGYFAKIDGKEMPLSKSAMVTACRCIKTEPKYFNQFPDKNAFPTTLRHILDNPSRRSSGVQLRHNGLEINSILPVDYQIRDAYDLLSEFVDALSTSLGDVRGIVPQEEGWGDSVSYRVVLGNNLMPSVSDAHGQFIMFVLNMSEVGLHPTKTMLGLFRTICTNSAVRGSNSTSKWDHRSNMDKFLNGSHETIRNMGYMSGQFGKIFGELLGMRLEHGSNDIVHAMQESGVITREHARLAEQYANMPTEDGRPVETHYDLFNVMTRAAQDLPTIKSKESAEAAAMDLFTAPGGLYAALRQAASKRRNAVALLS